MVKALKTKVEKNARGLAPMEGVTDFPTRLWFRYIGGMDFLWTPFLRVTDTFPARLPEHFAPEILQLKGKFKTPTILQVMGSRPDDVIRTFNLVGDLVDSIDLNCGCPSPTVVGSRAGSSLLERVDDFAGFVSKVVSAIGPGRLSVKMRTGFHAEEEFLGLFSAIKHMPLKHLTVHGRTRPQRYTGLANWSLIKTAAIDGAFPVIGSGDICDPHGMRRRLSNPSAVHAVIVGRGALRNPWIFQGRLEAPVGRALLLYIVMQDVFISKPSDFIRWAGDEPAELLETSDDFWRVTQNVLSRTGSSFSSPTEVQCSPRALSRGKMMWNYMRSSLPRVFMDPRIMRVTTLSDLIIGINEISRQSSLDPDNLPLCYQSDHDWIYSGQGRTPAVNQNQL